MAEEAEDNKGTFIDPRDGRKYKTVKIGEQVWLAENLNYKESGSRENNARKYGRLYTFEQAKKACPPGWHLPSDEEWGILIRTAYGEDNAGHHLKTANGWGYWKEEDEEYEEPFAGGSRTKYRTNYSFCEEEDYCGVDTFGFSALPGGDDSEHSEGAKGYWWGNPSYFRISSGEDIDIIKDDGSKSYYSVRCIKDTAEYIAKNAKNANIADSCLQSGRDNYKKGNYYDAIDDLTKAIKLREKANPNDYHWRGNANFQCEKYDKAIDDLTKAIVLRENANAADYYWRGRAYYQNKDYSSAIDDFTEVIVLSEKADPVDYYWRGWSNYRKNNYDAAIADLTEAIGLRKNPDDYQTRGYAYLDKGDYGAAIADFTKAAELRTKPSVNDYYWRGQAYLKKGDKNAARKDFEKVLEIDPNHSNAKEALRKKKKPSKLKNILGEFKDLFWPGYGIKDSNDIRRKIILIGAIIGIIIGVVIVQRVELDIGQGFGVFWFSIGLVGNIDILLAAFSELMYYDDPLWKKIPSCIWDILVYVFFVPFGPFLLFYRYISKC